MGKQNRCRSNGVSTELLGHHVPWVVSSPGPPDEVTMVREHLTVRPTSRDERVADFSAWVRDYQRPLLGFAQLIAGDPQTGEDLLQTALARAYLKWSKIGAAGQDPVGYIRRIIVNENASLWRHAWKRRERSTATLPEPATSDEGSIDLTWSAVQALPTRQRPRSRCASMPI